MTHWPGGFSVAAKSVKNLVKVIANWKLTRCQDSKFSIGGGERGKKKNVFELVFACRKYRFWVDILSEVFHGIEN